MGVVEYIADDRLAIQEMHRVLKPGGYAVITCPNYFSPWRRWSVIHWGLKDAIKRLIGRKPYPWVFHREYREAAYKRMLQDAGFEVVDLAYYNFKLFLEPLNRWFPNGNLWLAAKCERFCRGALRWLGTGFVVKAVKR